jgi:hypothetical protein
VPEVHDIHPPLGSDDDGGSSLDSSDSGRDDLPPSWPGPSSLAPWLRVYHLVEDRDPSGSPLPFLSSRLSVAAPPGQSLMGRTVGRGSSAGRKQWTGPLEGPPVKPKQKSTHFLSSRHVNSYRAQPWKSQLVPPCRPGYTTSPHGLSQPRSDTEAGLRQQWGPKRILVVKLRSFYLDADRCYQVVS